MFENHALMNYICTLNKYEMKLYCTFITRFDLLMFGSSTIKATRERRRCSWTTSGFPPMSGCSRVGARSARGYRRAEARPTWVAGGVTISCVAGRARDGRADQQGVEGNVAGY